MVSLGELTSPWADPGIFARGGGGGGGGVQAQLAENSSGNIFFSFFLVLNLFYSFTEGVQWLFQRNYNFQRFHNIFQEGSNSFQWDPNANFYRNPYYVWFSEGGGSGPPIPPLDPGMESTHGLAR